MRLALLYRLAIPLLLTLVSASVFFRALILVVLAIAFSFLLLLLSRLAGNVTGKAEKTTKDVKKVIESNYKIVDDNEEPSNSENKS
jgi:hypothetical protein